jgi:hypothetical protein
MISSADTEFRYKSEERWEIDENERQAKSQDENEKGDLHYLYLHYTYFTFTYLRGL